MHFKNTQAAVEESTRLTKLIEGKDTYIAEICESVCGKCPDKRKEDWCPGELCTFTGMQSRLAVAEIKADLVDELVGALQAFVSGITNDSPDAGDEIHMALINATALLKKAEAI